MAGSNMVIMLHRVKYSEWLEAILMRLAARYRFARAEDVVRFYKGDWSEPFVHVTADDGDRSFYENAYPVLKEHGIPATIFVSPRIVRERVPYWFQIIDRIDRRHLACVISKRFGLSNKMIARFGAKEIMKNLAYAEIEGVIRECNGERGSGGFQPNIGVEELKEMLGSGLVEAGAHTVRHPILANESKDNSEREILDSISELSELTGERIDYFAYPNGTPGRDFGEREMKTLERAGIELGFSTRVDHLARNDSRFDVPRIGISYGSPAFAAAKIRFGRQWALAKRCLRQMTGKSRKALDKEISKPFLKNR